MRMASDLSGFRAIPFWQNHVWRETRHDCKAKIWSLGSDGVTATYSWVSSDRCVLSRFIWVSVTAYVTACFLGLSKNWDACFKPMSDSLLCWATVLPIWLGKLPNFWWVAQLIFLIETISILRQFLVLSLSCDPLACPWISLTLSNIRLTPLKALIKRWSD